MDRRIFIAGSLIAAGSLLTGCSTASPKTGQPTPEKRNRVVVEYKTICNPLDLSYRFCPKRNDDISRREAGDATIIRFKDEYWLFASKSGGYWYSADLLEWTFVETNEIPTEEYAPCAIVLNDTVYFLASSRKKSAIYKSSDPKSGKWEVVRDEINEPVWDPSFYLDEDGRLYLYWGCSNNEPKPIYGVELDRNNNFEFIGERTGLFHRNPGQYGWEVPGDYNTNKDTVGWIEGAWVNKVNSNYYLQYSSAGAQFKSYCDAVYTAKSPLGPYTLQKHNPFCYRPEGFAAAAGHGSTFKDKYGNFWHIGTASISQKHQLERRLSLHLVLFDEDGLMHAPTQFGDYPTIIPNKKVESFDEIFPGWMLLSYDKPVKTSSTKKGSSPYNLNDEDIRTYWAAKSGSNNEWASIDLGEGCDIHAVQINFAEDETKIYNRQPNLKHRYIIEASDDEEEWVVLVDKSENTDDRSHQYIQFDSKVNFQHLRIKNLEVPGGNFAISGFRVFGFGKGEVPAAVTNFVVERNENDRREVKLNWDKVENATGYNIKFGTAHNKLYHTYQVINDNSLTIRSLNSELQYFFDIEAFNENGVSE